MDIKTHEPYRFHGWTRFPLWLYAARPALAEQSTLMRDCGSNHLVSLLDVRCEQQQVHHLCDPRPCHPPQPARCQPSTPPRHGRASPGTDAPGRAAARSVTPARSEGAPGQAHPAAPCARRRARRCTGTAQVPRRSRYPRGPVGANREQSMEQVGARCSATALRAAGRSSAAEEPAPRKHMSRSQPDFPTGLRRRRNDSGPTGTSMSQETPPS